MGKHSAEPVEPLWASAWQMVRHDSHPLALVVVLLLAIAVIVSTLLVVMTAS